MKNKCFLLVKNRMISQLGINEIKYAKGKAKKRKQFLMFFIVLIILIFAAYSGGYAYGLSYLGAGNLIPDYAFILCTIISLFFCMFKTSGELFGYKDYDFLMSIPVKTSTIIASRFINLYLWNTAITFVVMIPMGIIYAVSEKVTFAFVPLWIISMFLVCFIPTTIAVLIGALITAVSSKFRNSKLISELFLILLLFVILIVPFLLINSNFTMGNGKINQVYLKNVLVEVHDKLCAVYPVTKLFNEIVTHYDLISLVLFAVISIGWYLLFVMVLSLKYKQINTAISTYHVMADYEVHSLKQSNALSALYKKELKRWGSCPIYMTNTIVGAIMILILTVALFILGPAKLDELSRGSVDASMLRRVYPYVIAACLGLSCTTMASISLEGKNVWLLQSLPIDMKNITSSKLLVNLTITIPSAIIASTMFIVKMKPDVASGLIVYIVPIIFSLFSAVFGLWLNLKVHNYSWESETQVVKQSPVSLAGMLLSPLISVIFILLCAATAINNILIALIAILLIVIITGMLYNSIMKNYQKVPL